MAQASGVEKARFESLNGGGTFTVQFNPKELKIDEKASWKASDEHGADKPQLTYEKGEPTSLTMELIFDTSDTKENVNTKFIVPLRGFMTANYEDKEVKDATGGGSNKRPTFVKFIWGSFEFDGVVEKVNATFLMFASDGTPIRAKAQVGLKERTRPKHAIGAGGGVTLAAGPIVVGGGVAGYIEGQAKVYEVKEGDTIDKVAANTGAEARNILDANGCDPIDLEPGEPLVIPMTDDLTRVLKRRRRRKPKKNYKRRPIDPFDESRNLIDNDPGPSAIEENAPVALDYDDEVGDFANAYISFGPEYEGAPVESTDAIGEYGATGAGDGEGHHGTHGANPIGEGMGRGEAMAGDREAGDAAIGEYGATGAGDGEGHHGSHGANPIGEGMGRGEAMAGDREVGDAAIGEFGATGAGDGEGHHSQHGADPLAGGGEARHSQHGANPTGEGMGRGEAMAGDREVGDAAIGEFGATGAGDGEGHHSQHGADPLAGGGEAGHSQHGANPTGEGMGRGEAMAGDREAGDAAVGEYGASGAGDGEGQHSQHGANPTGEGLGHSGPMGGDREVGDKAINEAGGGAGGAGGGASGGDRAGVGGHQAGGAGEHSAAGGRFEEAGGRGDGAGGESGGGRGARAHQAAEDAQAASGGGGGRRGQAGSVNVDPDKMREDQQERDAEPRSGGGRQGQRGQVGEDGPGGGGAGAKLDADGDGTVSRKEAAEAVADRAEAKTGERPDTKEEVKRAGKAMGLGEVIREAKKNAKDNPSSE